MDEFIQGLSNGENNFIGRNLNGHYRKDSGGFEKNSWRSGIWD
jgi:hypothetical protein